MEGAELRLGRDQKARSTTTGSFAFEFPKRPSKLVAAYPGAAPVVRERVSKDTPMPLLLEFSARAMSISGRVVDPNGAPVPGMLVTLVDPTRGGADASLERLSAPPVELPHGALSRCGADGSFAIGGLVDRRYRLRAYDPETLVSVESEEIAAGTTGVVMTVDADSLRGRRGRFCRRA